MYFQVVRLVMIFHFLLHTVLYFQNFSVNMYYSKNFKLYIYVKAI